MDHRSIGPSHPGTGHGKGIFYYYLEKTDEEFEEKMAQVLVVYKEVQQGREGNDQGKKSSLLEGRN